MAVVSEPAAQGSAEQALRTLYARVLELERSSLELQITLAAVRGDRDRLLGLVDELGASCDAYADAIHHLDGEVRALRRSRAYRWGSAPRRLLRGLTAPER